MATERHEVPIIKLFLIFTVLVSEYLGCLSISSHQVLEDALDTEYEGVSLLKAGYCLVRIDQSKVFRLVLIAKYIHDSQFVSSV